MKRFFTIVMLSLLFICHSNAQITITNLNYNSSPGVDSIIGIANLDIVNFRGENLQWNLNCSGNDFRFNDKKGNINDSFPGAKYYNDSIFDVIAATRGIYRSDYYTATDNYFGVLGFECKSQSYFIGDLTSNTKDSIALDSYVQKFTNPLVIYKFPMTYGTVNKSSCVRDINTKLTITNFMLNKAKATKRTYYNLNDTVVGWGYLKLNWNETLESKVSSDNVPVLVIKRETTSVDSVLLNNAPAPALLLTSFGLTQGKVTKSYQYIFLSSEFAYPLLKAYSDSPDMTSFQTIYINRSALKHYNAVEDEPGNSAALRISPNPATETIELNIPENIEFMNLNIYNSFGDLVKTINKSELLGSKTISIVDLPAGAYFVRIDNSFKTCFTKMN